MRRKSAISTCFKTKTCCQIREKQAGAGSARYHGQLLRQAARPGARGGAQVAMHRKKKVHEFPVSSRDVTNHTPPGQE